MENAEFVGLNEFYELCKKKDTKEGEMIDLNIKEHEFQLAYVFKENKFPVYTCYSNK